MEKQLIEALQQRLLDLGWYQGKVDGDAGSMTRAAISEFKAAAGLNPRDFVGPLTLLKLFDAKAPARPAPEPAKPGQAAAGSYPWMKVAENLKGLRETPGAGNNKTIMGWAKDAGIDYAGDDVAWCGLFAAHCMRAAIPGVKLPPNPLGARNWLKFGKPVAPQVGAILVFWRVSKSGWQGHVGLYAAEDATHFYVLGGNQDDAVTISRIAKSPDRLLGARFPDGFIPSGKKAHMSAAGVPVTTNEA